MRPIQFFKSPSSPNPLEKWPTPSRSTRIFIDISPIHPVHRNWSPPSPGPRNGGKSFVQPKVEFMDKNFFVSVGFAINPNFLRQLALKMDGIHFKQKNAKNFETLRPHYFANNHGGWLGPHIKFQPIMCCKIGALASQLRPKGRNTCEYMLRWRILGKLLCCQGGTPKNALRNPKSCQR